jgi:DNA polymerase-3 subunit beta
MKFTIDAKAFSGAIASIAKAVEARNTIPILSNIVVSAKDDGITLKATDLDLEISSAVTASVIEPGETTIPARLASDIAKKLSGEITFNLKDGEQQASISAGRSKFQIMTLPIDDYPSLSVGEFTHSFVMTGDALHRALSAVEFAISTEETRYYLNGVFVHVEGVENPKLRFVSTDGHRLARMELDAPDGAIGMPGIIVPRKTVKEAISIASAAKGDEVRIDVSETKIRFTHGNTVLTSKIIDGSFPEYQRVIPPMSNIFAEVDAKSFAAAADRVATISSERGKAVKLTFSRDGLTLVTNNPDAGSAEDFVEADFDAEQIDIGFSAKYVADVLRSMGDGEAKVSLTDSGSPTIFTNEDRPELLVVLMPMRV